MAHLRLEEEANGGDAWSDLIMPPKVISLVAFVLTAVVVCFHIVYVPNAGALWRDEANTVAMAQMASVSEIWANIEFDSFPALWMLVLRLFQSLGLTRDLELRLLGCFVGLSIVAALWMNARFMRFSVPLISLVLLGFSPTVIRWGDSMRAYGFALFLMLLTFGLVWRVVKAPSPGVVAIAVAVAIASVQTIYHNAVILFAIGTAGTIVAVRNRQWKRALIVLSIGAAAALSLIPYLNPIQRAKAWNIIFASEEFTLPYFWTKFSEALCSTGAGIQWLWVALAVAAVVSGVVAQSRDSAPEESDRRDASLYCVTALLVAIPAYFVFLRILSYPTQPWYYLALMGLVAVAVDGALAGLHLRMWSTVGRAAVAVGVAVWAFVPAWDSTQIRQTNLDLIAGKIKSSGVADDMIVVAPFFFGITFDRYYEGRISWTTLPPIADHKVHRYDLLKERMAAANPIDPVLEAMGNALKSGHGVWIVGGLTFLPADQRPRILSPAPGESFGWSESAYSTTWSMQVAYFLQMNALQAEVIKVDCAQPINSFENASLILFRGWRTR